MNFQFGFPESLFGNTKFGFVLINSSSGSIDPTGGFPAPFLLLALRA